MIVTARGLRRHHPGLRGCGRGVRVCLLLLFLAAMRVSAQGLSYSGGAVDAGSTPVGSASTAVDIRLTVPAGSTTVTGASFKSEGVASQEFTATANTCTGVVSGPGTCTISVVFNPRQTGLRRGVVTITSTGNVPLMVYLRGTGQGSQLVFSPTSAAATSTVTPLSPVYYSPTTAVYDGDGNLFFNDVLNNRILRQSAAGTLSTVFSLPGNIMSAMAISPAGDLYVSVPSQSAVYRVVPGGDVGARCLQRRHAQPADRRRDWRQRRPLRCRRAKQPHHPLRA